jgi:hypothetical protein
MDIKTLNDKFRKTLLGGKVMLTRGIYSKGQACINEILDSVKTFNNFNENNDPYNEHDYGSFEYDAADLDSYYEMNSAFYNDVESWQWGVSAAWYPAENHEFLLQAANSPLSTTHLSFATGWRGSWDWFESYWTASLWGHDRGMDPSVALGNRFTFGSLMVDIDLSARFGETDLSGATALIAPSYQFGDWGRAFTKIGIENDNTFFGCGFEYFPLKENKDIRLHAAYTYNDYTVGHLVNIGLFWRMNVTQTIKNIFTKLN